jgi:ferritin-like metal-binding protein YciE
MPSLKAKGLEELFTDTLKDIYFAEKQILRALPKMAKSASSQELSQAFEKHREETEGHVERLEEIFETMKKPARGKTCDAIIGIIEEGKEIMEEYAGDSALDAGLAASAQAVEHYEIARYGTLRTWAEQLGMKDATMLLNETLQEEIKTDQLLTKLAPLAGFGVFHRGKYVFQRGQCLTAVDNKGAVRFQGLEIEMRDGAGRQEENDCGCQTEPDHKIRARSQRR